MAQDGVALKYASVELQKHRRMLLVAVGHLLRPDLVFVITFREIVPRT